MKTRVNVREVIEERFENRILCCATCKWFQSKNDVIGSTFTCHKYSHCNYAGAGSKRFEFINGEEWIAIHVNHYHLWELPEDRMKKRYLLEEELFEI